MIKTFHYSRYILYTLIIFIIYYSRWKTHVLKSLHSSLIFFWGEEKFEIRKLIFHSFDLILILNVLLAESPTEQSSNKNSLIWIVDTVLIFIILNNLIHMGYWKSMRLIKTSNYRINCFHRWMKFKFTNFHERERKRSDWGRWGGIMVRLIFYYIFKI